VLDVQVSFLPSCPCLSDRETAIGNQYRTVNRIRGVRTVLMASATAERQLDEHAQAVSSFQRTSCSLNVGGAYGVRLLLVAESGIATAGAGGSLNGRHGGDMLKRQEMGVGAEWRIVEFVVCLVKVRPAKKKKVVGNGRENYYQRGLPRACTCSWGQRLLPDLIISLTSYTSIDSTAI
jgi:hypothetical protein